MLTTANIAPFDQAKKKRVSRRDKGRLVRGLVVALAMFSFSSVTPAQAEPVEQPSTQFVLEGLKSIHVSVGRLDDVSLERSKLRKAVEKRFEKAGMKTIDEKEFLNHTDNFKFYVTVTPLKHNRKLFYSVNVGLTQMLRLPDKPSRKVDVTTWQDEAVGLVDAKNDSAIQDRVLERVDGFIDLWQRANDNEEKSG